MIGPKITKEISTNNLVASAQERINNRMQRKENNFGVNFGEGKNITSMLNE